MLILGKDRQERPVHKGEGVRFFHNGVVRQGVLQSAHKDQDILMLIIVRGSKKYYVFEREVVSEVKGRLVKASATWRNDLMERLKLRD